MFPEVFHTDFSTNAKGLSKMHSNNNLSSANTGLTSVPKYLASELHIGQTLSNNGILQLSQ